jgi:D-alanyl-D-alanine carboxypeptidase
MMKRADGRSGFRGQPRLLSIVLLLLIGFAATGFGPPALIPADDLDGRITVDVVASVRSATPPEVAASSYVIVDGRTATMVHGKQERQRRAPASSVKLMTALVARELLPPTRLVPITFDARTLIGSSVMGLRSGDELTVEDLLYGLMLPSGNDAALQLALTAATDVDTFVQRMNARAADLGLRDTRFRNPHGLDDPDQYTSAADLAILAREVLKDDLLARIVRTRTHVVQGRFVYSLANTNLLLGQRVDADGVKTGTTEQAGRVLVGSASQDGRRGIVVVLQAEDRFSEASILLDYFFAAFDTVTFDVPPSPFYVDSLGRPWRTQNLPDIVVSAWEAHLRQVEVISGHLPGDAVRIRYRVGGKQVGETTIVGQ